MSKKEGINKINWKAKLFLEVENEELKKINHQP